MMRRLLKYILLIPVLVSCSREDIPVNEDDAIAFSVSAPGLIVTRAEITNDVAGRTIENGVLDGNIGIRLHELLIPDFLYGQRLEPEVMSGSSASDRVFSGRWFPEVPAGMSKFSWSNRATEGIIPEMSFFAFAFSPSREYGSNIVVTQNTRGREVTITQPSSYESEFCDYLLAYQINVPQQQVGANYPLLSLDFEHAMSKVELYVNCAEVFVEKPDKYEIRLREVTFRDIYRKARLSCTHHAVSGTQDENVWSVEYDKTYIADYSLPLDSNDGNPYRLLDLSDAEPGTPVKIMEFLAFPASSSMQYSLKIKYDIVEKEGSTVVDTDTFEFEPFMLKNYTPSGWRSGHKVKYCLDIDNGINLTGRITDWVEMDYMEGVILPEIEPEIE